MVVFEFSPTDQPSTAALPTAGPPTEGCVVGSSKALIEKLKQVTDWKVLGEELGMEAHRLEQIESDNASNEHKKREMLRYVKFTYLAATLSMVNSDEQLR